jgi:NADH pyrophosphatase NudC (nudix superfamily)
MENGKFFLFHRGKALLNSNKKEKFRKEPSLTSFEQAIEINPNLKTDSVFLRFSSEFGPLFATQVPDDVEIANIESRHNANFVDMRAAMFWVDDHRWAPILCQSHSLLNWNRKTQFCSSCGSRLTRNMSGSQRECSGCKSVHYPITSPVAIVLLTTPDHSKVIQLTRHVIGVKREVVFVIAT